MKDFESIGKRTPYAEHDDYVRKLIEQATEKAIDSQQKKTRTVSLRTKVIAAAAIAALLLGGFGISYHYLFTEQPTVMAENNNGPIDEFLNSLSDEDAQLLACYDIEEIPEYE